MAIFNVKTTAELTTALNRAVGGDRVLLASGNYGSFTLFGKTYASNVTIAAADPEAKPVFTSFILNTVKNVTVSGVEVAYALREGEATSTLLASVRSSTNVRIENSYIHGSLDGDPWNDGRGLTITGSTNVSIANSRFEELYQGISLFKNFNVTLRENEVTGIRYDGITVASTDGVVIDSNRMSNFKPDGINHSDFVQFWNTNETKGSSNATIKNNVFLQQNPNDDIGVQGIWINDPREYGFKNFLIENNLIYSNDQYHGIHIAGGFGVQILNNTVISSDTDDKQLWIYVRNGSDAIVAGNVTDNILFENQTRLLIGDNLNFRFSPEARARFNDLVDPDSSGDLRVDDYGFQTPTVMPVTSVAAAVSGGLGTLVANAVAANGAQTSASLGMRRIDEAPAADLPTFGQLFGAEGAGFAPQASVPFVPAAFFTPTMDHFTALP